MDRTSSTQAAQDSLGLPAQVRQLYFREKEVATIVYAMAGATAKDVEARVSSCLTNGAIRSMLNRLVDKGVLKRERRGSHGSFVYLPGVETAQAAERALRQVADDYFDGSLKQTAMKMLDLVTADTDRENAVPAYLRQAQAGMLMRLTVAHQQSGAGRSASEAAGDGHVDTDSG